MTTNYLEAIEIKVEKGERITSEDGLQLFGSDDVVTIGRIANRVRQRKNGNRATYILNHHIDYSNVCVLSCKFCAFAKKEGEEGAFFHDIDYYLEKLAAGLKEGITEVHIVGGLHPKLPFSYYTTLIRKIRRLDPILHVKAFTAVEIDFFARIFKKSVPQVLEELIEAGLGSMPGGGAEVFDEGVFQELCPGKMNAHQWGEVHRTAHRLGLKTNATMLYGHIEKPHHRIDHLERLRRLQDETGGFLSFIPLAFNPEHTELEHLGWTSGLDDLKTLAISRIYLDNFDHIKSYWITSSIGIAQLGLSFGADDIHGTVREENITHMAGAKVPQVLTVNDLKRLIVESGHEPHQRDSVYNILN